MPEDATQPEALYCDEPAECPVCRASFVGRRLSIYSILSREADFRAQYAGANPLHFEAWVCPACMYAGEPSRFKPGALELELVRTHVRERDAYLRGILLPPGPADRFRLLARLSLVRGAPARVRGDLWLSASWLAAEAGDTSTCAACRQEARDCFQQCAATATDPLERTYTYYLVGELCRLLGTFEEALQSFKAAFLAVDSVDEPSEKAFFAALIARQSWRASARQGEAVLLHDPDAHLSTAFPPKDSPA